MGEVEDNLAWCRKVSGSGWKDRLHWGWNAETKFLLGRPFDCKVAFDVGAHVGHFTHRLLNLGFDVYAFEPERYNHHQLKERTKGQKCLPICAAISDKDGFAPLYVSERYWGRHSLENNDDYHDEIRMVRTLTLKTFLEYQKIKKVGLLKVDTEGTDVDVLRGWDWEVHPEAIMCEFLSAKQLGGLADFLHSKPYDLYVSGWLAAPPSEQGKPSHAKHLWIKPYRTVRDVPPWGNLIAIRC